MPIRYCAATSKRTKKPCRARAMRGRKVCYHHGGKTPRGPESPHFAHGYYSKDFFTRLMWSITQAEYRRSMRQEHMAAIYADLRVNIPIGSKRSVQRLMATARVEIARMPDYRITPDMIPDVLEYMRQRWPGWFGD